MSEQIKDQIQAAIAAHSQWKGRLLDAIKTGQSEFKPNTVKLDNQCAFGKWLYSLPREQQESQACKEIKEGHAKFHQSAGRVLDLALAGKKEDAEKEIAFGSEYSKNSSHLVATLTKWMAEQ